MSMKDDLNYIPVGVVPHNLWKLGVMRERATDIFNAIERYKDVGIEISEKWIIEYNQLRDLISEIEE